MYKYPYYSYLVLDAPLKRPAYLKSTQNNPSNFPDSVQLLDLLSSNIYSSKK
jgi:hypothetical protein